MDLEEMVQKSIMEMMARIKDMDDFESQIPNIDNKDEQSQDD